MVLKELFGPCKSCTLWVISHSPETQSHSLSY